MLLIYIVINQPEFHVFRYSNFGLLSLLIGSRPPTRCTYEPKGRAPTRNVRRRVPSASRSSFSHVARAVNYITCVFMLLYMCIALTRRRRDERETCELRALATVPEPALLQGRTVRAPRL